jgi:hypothetical protein
VSPWYTRQDRDRDHDSVRVRAFALEARLSRKARSWLGDEKSIIVRECASTVLGASVQPS